MKILKKKLKIKLKMNRGTWYLRRTLNVNLSAPGKEVHYRQVSNVRRIKFQHLKDSRTVLRLSLPNPLKPDVKSRMKM